MTSICIHQDQGIYCQTTKGLSLNPHRTRRAKTHHLKRVSRLGLLLIMLHKHTIPALGGRPIVPMTSSTALLLVASPVLAVAVRAALLGIRIVHEQLAVLAVAPRLDLGLVHDLEDALPAGGDLVEDAVHLLEGAVGRLRVEEVHRGDHEGVDDCEDDVGLVADRVEGDGRDHHDHEVENPIAGGGQRVGGGADPQRHDLGRVQPGHAEPADGEEGVEDEEEDDARDARALVVGLLEFGVDARQDRHGGRLARGAEEHEVPAADALHEEDGGPRGDEVLGAVEGGEEAGHEVGHAEIAVDDGRVVRDEVDSRNLLEHLVDVSKQGAVQVAMAAHGEQIAECTLGHLKDSVLDLVELVVDYLVVDVRIVQGGKNLPGLVLSPLENEPPGRLGEGPDEAEDKDAEDDLEGQRESPRHGTGGEGKPQINPVRYHDSAGDQGALDHDEFTALVSMGRLGLPSGHGGRVPAVSKASDDSADNEVVKGECRGLEDGADSHDGGSQHDHSLATEGVANEDGDDSAEKASQVVGCNGDALVRGASSRVGTCTWVDVGKLLKEDG